VRASARKVALAALVALAPATLAIASACGPSSPAGMQATKPLSPADGAKDYAGDPPGPDTPTPIGSGPGVGARAGSTEQPTGCPPRCGADGAWRGCGLRAPRAGACAGCAPRCLGKGTGDEGWYDCSGILIVRGACS
jgi:hypothetical protein